VMALHLGAQDSKVVFRKRIDDDEDDESGDDSAADKKDVATEKPMGKAIDPQPTPRTPAGGPSVIGRAVK